MGEPLPPHRRFYPPSTNGEGIAARYLFMGGDRSSAFVDRSIEHLWGVGSAALRQDPRLWLQRIHPDDRQAVAVALDGPSGTSWDLEYRVQRPDGTLVWVHDRGRALSLGRSRQVSGRVIDVTRQRRLEDHLSFQGQLLEAAGEAVIAADAGGSISSWNPAAARLFGYEAADAVGQPLVELAFGAAERAALREALDGVFALGTVWSGERRLLRRDGAEVPGHVTLAPLTDAEGEVVGVVALAVDVSELRAAQERAEDSEREQRRLVAQLRRLTAHLHSVREEEQTRIAREVHDELGQMLTGLKLDVGWLRRRAESGNGHLPGAQLRERLAGIGQLVDHTLDAVRHIARQLRPPALDDLGLETALEWLAEEVRSRTGIACELRWEVAGPPVPPPYDTVAFRIVQESLTNVSRHAEASRVTVRIRRDGEALLIDVEDDGRGVPRAALRAPDSLGILGMRERAHALGGELSVRRRKRGGTRVHARLPIAPAVESEAAAAAARGERVAAEAAP